MAKLRLNIDASLPRACAMPLAAALLNLACATPSVAEPSSPCANPSDRGFEDGRRGAKQPAAALKACPTEAATYQSAYRAGAYMRSLDRTFGGGDRVIAPSPGTNGASSGAFSTTEPLDAGTQRTLRRLRCSDAAKRAAAASGGPAPLGCPPALGSTDSFQRGVAERRAQSQALQNDMERARINTRLLSPNLPAAERRMIENRLRLLNQQDGLRRLNDPYLR